MEQKHQDKLRLRAGHYIDDDISIWLKDDDALEIETEHFRVVLTKEQAQKFASHVDQLWLDLPRTGKRVSTSDMWEAFAGVR